MSSIPTIFSDKMYNVLKFIALIALPALAVLCLGLGQLWNLSNTSQIAGTITLIDVFLGALLQISTKQYNSREDLHDGTLSINGVDEETGMPNLSMTITKDPHDLVNSKTVRLKTKKVTPKATNRG